MTEVLRSRLLEALGFRHGFNSRRGGVSLGPYASLNLGRAVGDDPAAVHENHQRFARAVGYEPEQLYEASQVHGRDVLTVPAGADARELRKREADALCAPGGAVAVGVRVADCVPVLLADTRTGAVAAVHAGWRGTERGVIEAAIAALAGLAGSSPEDFVAAIFPHIARCCFEVGEDVADALLAVSPDRDVVDRSRSKPHVDLSAIVTAKLLAAGLRAERVERVPGCTRCEPERFFSFRRDGQRSGRHLSAIVSR